MYKACSRCGRVHDSKYRCYTDNRVSNTEESKLRSSNKWKTKSLEIREKAQHLCEVCRDQGIYTYTGLEVHHIERISDAKHMLLDNDNLICLCVFHHKQADANDLSKEYLRSLAKKREERAD